MQRSVEEIHEESGYGGGGQKEEERKMLPLVEVELSEFDLLD